MVMPKKKTTQVRITDELYSDVSMIAPTFGMEANEYVEHVTRIAVARDLQKAAAVLKERAEAAGKRKPPSD
jgi:hypothetical protein